MWAGTEDGGLTRYRNRSFRTFSTRDGLPHDWVNALRSDRGKMLIATEAGLVFLDAEGFIPYTPGPGEPSWLYAYRGAQGTYWYLDDAGLKSVKDGVTSSYNAPNGLNLYDIHSVSQCL